MAATTVRAAHRLPYADITGIIPRMVPDAPRRFLVLSRFALLLLLGAAGCAPKFERPNLSVSSIEMQGGNLLQQNFLVKFQVQNPNRRALPVSGLHAELDVAGERIASGVSNKSFVVPPMGQIEFDMTITANMALALLKLSSRHGDSIDYEVTGAASLNLPFMHDLPFHQTGSLSLKQFH
jgi:LEA14-like dessication related protein